jgi:hypothetical protein
MFFLSFFSKELQNFSWAYTKRKTSSASFSMRAAHTSKVILTLWVSGPFPSAITTLEHSNLILDTDCPEAAV